MWSMSPRMTAQLVYNVLLISVMEKLAEWIEVYNNQHPHRDWTYNPHANIVIPC